MGDPSRDGRVGRIDDAIVRSVIALFRTPSRDGIPVVVRGRLCPDPDDDAPYALSPEGFVGILLLLAVWSAGRGGETAAFGFTGFPAIGSISPPNRSTPFEGIRLAISLTDQSDYS
jgi:hypothetical protein